MIIGVPREAYHYEHRVGLTPSAASRLTEDGHKVFVEHNAGLKAHFSDEQYQKSGAHVVYSQEEIYKRTDLVCRVRVISAQELDLLKPGLIICGFQHLAAVPRRSVEHLMKLRTTLIGYELVRDGQGRLSILTPFSEMLGQMSVHVAACGLQYELGGRGILMGSIPGVPPPTVLILGAGTVAHSAARQAVACGADRGVLR